MATAVSGVNANDGSAAFARSMKSRTESTSLRSAASVDRATSGTGSEDTRRMTSPAIRSGSLLVARILEVGTRGEQLADERCAGVEEMLAIVEHDQGAGGSRSRP